MHLDEKNIDRLMNAALKAREKAYAPYSGFAVGAAVLTKSGYIYTGANIENASYGLTICAERMAVGAAVNTGDSDILVLLVVGGNIKNPDESKRVTPCGSCRQVLSEFMPDDAIVIAAALNGKYDTYIMKNLLPKAFKLKGPTE
jgi:cytidine deaminase